MTKAHLLSIFLVLSRLHGCVNADISSLQKQFMCDDVDLTKLIEFPYDRKCLQVALNGLHHVPCILQLLGAQPIPLQIRSLTSLIHRDISSENQETCQTFLIFADSINVVTEIFNFDQRNKKQFFPFTKIYFYISENRDETNNLDSMTQTLLKNVLMTNALFGYIFELTEERIGPKVLIKDILTNDIRRSIPTYTPSDLLHPIVDLSLLKESFTISLFNCDPFTFYSEEADDNM